ncbi:MAG: response regulator [Verrucomicrobia bacterium]|nr:response regulator [Verrucomicrobiota bacterium]
MNNPIEVEVLLVEDNPRDAEMTLRSLRRRHLANHVVHVKDGQEALDWLNATGNYVDRDCSQNPKLVLLDLKLPKVDGLEVLRSLRASPRTRLIPVVILTSSREDKDVIEGYELGVNSYVVKPLDFDKFSTAVAELGQYWLLVNETPK